MKLNRGVVVILCCLLGYASCSRNDRESQLREVVEGFSTAYFNWQFRRAVPYCTNESVIWLRYAASQVHQEDVDILHAQEFGASHDIDDIWLEGDSAMVTVEVRNYLRMDTIGREGRMISEAAFRLPAVFRNGKWKVCLSGMPRAYRSK